MYVCFVCQSTFQYFTNALHLGQFYLTLQQVHLKTICKCTSMYWTIVLKRSSIRPLHLHLQPLTLVAYICKQSEATMRKCNEGLFQNIRDNGLELKCRSTALAYLPDPQSPQLTQDRRGFFIYNARYYDRLARIECNNPRASRITAALNHRCFSSQECQWDISHWLICTGRHSSWK